MTEITHERNTSREGILALLGVAITTAGFVAFHTFLFPLPWRDCRTFAVIYIAIGAVVAVAVGIYGIFNIMCNGKFICRLDNETIECVSPVKGCGDSFKVKINDIVKIEKEEWAESYRWYIWDSADHRYWPTSNYGNPADDLIEAIRETNDSIIYSER